jgi:transcriptional regulator with XRE-family HTH domain
MKAPPESDFSNALRRVRKARGLTQEDFDDISSRVYISALERGVKQPTLPKVDALAGRLGVHPLTLLALAYCRKPASEDVRQVLGRVLAEMEALPLDPQGT